MEDALTVKRVSLGSIHEDPANVRLHDERNLDAIQGSLVRFGQQKPIVVDRAGVIRAGNGTYAAAKALGWTEIDVVETDLEGVEATAYSIADNRSSDLSSFDESALAQLLHDLQGEGGLDGVGYTDKELDELVAGLTNEVPDVIEDEVPGLPDAATSRRGDVWRIGRHRLMCGDSSSVGDVDRLIAGAVIHLVNCDPPYNVKVEPRSNNAIAAGLSSFTSTHHQGLDLARHPSKAHPTHEKLRPKDRPLANDFLPEEEFDRMLRAWFGNVARVLVPGRAFYIWGGYGNLGNYPPALRENDLYFSQAVIWVKEHPVLTRKDFMGNHEWCFYGWREGAAHQFYGPANAPDVWSVKKLNHTAMVHLTEKPVELAARAIAYSSREGENVLDLFGGSGSTMAACEQTGRTGYLMEIDPLYCDVIVERIQKLAGVDAVLEGSVSSTIRERRGSAASGALPWVPGGAAPATVPGTGMEPLLRRGATENQGPRATRSIAEGMTSLPGLQVRLRTPDNEQFEGLCTDLDSCQQELVALVAFRPERAPAVGLGEKTSLTFLGGGLVSSIAAEGTTLLRSDDRSQRCYSFQLGDVPKSMLLLLGNRRGSTRQAARGAVCINLLDIPRDVLSPRVVLHDISATGLSIIVEPAVERLLLKQVELRFSLMFPGEEPVELVAAIRHRRILGSQFLYGLEFDGQLPAFMRSQERFLAYLSSLR